MLTIKKRTWPLGIFAILLLTALTACGPRGPRDLRRGQQLIDEGRFADAISVLRDGVQLLTAEPAPVQANALNLLGLAYQGAGQLDTASQSYMKALKLDRDLVAADYNLGCLRLQQSDYTGSIDYLTTYTTLRPKDINGVLNLGRARVKLAMTLTGAEKARQLEGARRDYEYAEGLRSSAEACNALGLIEIETQRRTPGPQAIRVAAAHFEQALQDEPHYAPALLNLAILEQHYLNNPKTALEKYREYLAVQPPPANAREVEEVAHQLDVDLRTTIIPQPEERTVTPQVRTSTPTPKPAPIVSVPFSTPTPAPAPIRQKSPPVEIPISRPLIIAQTEPTYSTTRAEPPRAASTPNYPSIITTPRASTSQPSSAPSAPSDVNTGANLAETPSAKPPARKKRTFVQKLNPLHWFGGKSQHADENPENTSSSSRYKYPSAITPIPGNRNEAERLTNDGRRAARQSNRAEAMQDYQAAIRADPTYYPANLALGMTAIDSKEYQKALDALSHTLIVEPSSVDGRYAFAWVLGKEGYYQDAANELERLLVAHPRELRAHLLLGNYYADNLGQPALARDQYLTALEIDPQNSQAAAIRLWLRQNP